MTALGVKLALYIGQFNDHLSPEFVDPPEFITGFNSEDRIFAAWVSRQILYYELQLLLSLNLKELLYYISVGIMRHDKRFPLLLEYEDSLNWF